MFARQIFFLNLFFFGIWVYYLKEALERKEAAFLEDPLEASPGHALPTLPMAAKTCFMGGN